MITQPSTIPHIVQRHVERWPDREVVTFRDLESSSPHDAQINYEQLWSQATAFAEALSPAGPESPVLIVLPLGTRLLAAHLGTMLAGAIPIIHSHPSAKMERSVYISHLSHVLAQLRPAAVVTNREFIVAIQQAGIEGRCLVVQEELVPKSVDVRVDKWMEVHPDEVAVIQHSSGTTGLQKGVALSHRMVVDQCDSYGRAILLDPTGDRVCSWLPLYHDMGLFTTWLLPLLEAVPVVAMDPFAWVQSPVSILQVITEFRGTLCWQPNFAYNLLAARVHDDELSSLDLSSMRAFVNCSEPVRARSHRLFLDRFAPTGLRTEALWVCYAMAENAFAVTSTGPTNPPTVLALDAAGLSHRIVEPPAGGVATEVVSVGRAIDGCAIKIVDESRRPLPDGRVGEIALQSRQMLRGYYRNPEATAASIDGQSWYYTGDIGFTKNGDLYVTGRKKDLLIIGGRNFYPQDIEAICDLCPGVVPGRSAAIGVEDERTGTERIVVLVESRLGDDLERDRLSRTIRRRALEELDCSLSEVAVVPHMWLLKTTSGKIARRPNLERYRREVAESSRPALAQDASSRGRLVDPTLGAAGVLETVAWGFLTALILYTIATLQPNSSWGVYAGF